jgi:uncharacterized protein (TIGR02246 family)
MFLRKHRTPAVLTALAAMLVILMIAVRPATNLSEAQAQPATKSATGDEAAIRQANEDYVAAMIKGDLDAIMAFWAADADYIDEAGKMTRGKDQIAAMFKKTLPEVKGSKASGKIHSMKFLRPEICLEDGTLELTANDGTKSSSRYAVVWTKTGDKWLISSVRDLPAEVTDLPSLAAAQLKDLEWLVGEWADEGAKADVSVKVHWAANKAFLLMDYTLKQEGADPLDVNVRIGWDAANNRIRSWTFDSQGGFGEGFWQKNGKKWEVGASGVLPDGGIGGSTQTYEFVDANSLIWRATDREVDGQPLTDVEVKFVRKAGK